MIKNIEVNSETNPKVSKSFVSKVIGLLKRDLHFEISSIIINFVSAAKITEINKEFLDHHYSTDIITFSYSDELSVIDTEVYISIDDAKENAVKYKIDLNEEILRLIIHGILHVSGFDDKNPSDKAKMKRMENKLLKLYKNSLLQEETI